VRTILRAVVGDLEHPVGVRLCYKGVQLRLQVLLSLVGTEENRDLWGFLGRHVLGVNL